MSKIKWSEEKILQWQAEGRGKGTGANYQPWLKVTDFSSRGNSRRVFSQKTGRAHHFFSDVEWHLFLLLEHANDIIDIREQYPLDREDTIAIATRLGIRHPTDPETRVSTVMTCDILVTRQVGQDRILEAFNCKRLEEAENTRSIEKLEIQHSYFNGCDIAHRLIFHTMLPMVKVKNIEWMRNAHIISRDEIEPYEGYYRDHCERMMCELARDPQDVSVSEFSENYDTRHGVITGTGLRAIRMLLSQGIIVANLNELSIAGAPVSRLHPTGKNLQKVGG
ncbi:TnsA endonuclease N-terminal domain-containing protein [Crenobacter sp. SG2303]|uniref:TnsA endonuclease N-terminal domain-containing protein n=1 Tax=Crenobacter oryzisoli TaxID=3056844 RepID=A0ABT7XNR9_9NEIS|nr:TnsA endonuclease N-terminal domain-containing protein [Crenobacter sp. SG2303]MDN0075416.1 TnsA endonuclease N-terminal domain-containing protein [Crenobacter sp. SG2303]